MCKITFYWQIWNPGEEEKNNHLSKKRKKIERERKKKGIACLRMLEKNRSNRKN